MTFIDEMILAARGVFAITIGNRDSAKYFNLTNFGLTGATIALVLSFAISIFVPEFLGIKNNGLLPFQSLIFIGVVSLFQVGAAAVILYQLNRFDGFVPYLVVDFWSTFFITILTLVPVVFNLQSSSIMLVCISSDRCEIN
ncbi:MAG: hypothetical protein L3J15_02110 [Devosiaceae bacterium]|nr:hypothetical protein [Devosiaceae bacterium]